MGSKPPVHEAVHSLLPIVPYEKQLHNNAFMLGQRRDFTFNFKLIGSG
jgi:hypothetical protein